MNYTIRKAIPGDVAELVKLCAKHAEFEKEKYHKQNKAELLTAALFSQNPVLFCYVASNANSLIGYATYTREFATWDANFYIHMDCLFLKAEARGNGVGEALVKAIAVEAKSMDYEMQWQTPAFNVRALKFYNRLGATAKCKTRLYLDKESIQKLIS